MITPHPVYSLDTSVAWAKQDPANWRGIAAGVDDDADDDQDAPCSASVKALLGLDPDTLWDEVANAFCTTGPGGGINPHCGIGGAAVGSAQQTGTGFMIGDVFTSKRWRGQTYQVKVMATGFALTDPATGNIVTHGSLSAAATSLRGSPTNGRWFFNVPKLAGPSIITPASPPLVTPIPVVSPVPISPPVAIASAPTPGAIHPGSKLSIGATYSRSYQGQTHMLTVTPQGFQVVSSGGAIGQYKSLSAAASAVHGSPTNGWWFFKIPKPGAPINLGGGSPPLAAPLSSPPVSATPHGLHSTIPFQAETIWETGKPGGAGIINGIPFDKAPSKFWEKVKDVDIKEPKPVKPIERVGVMIQEPDGRIWVVQPTNHYGDRKHTLPGGHVEPGLTDQQNALKEVWEETGLQVEITRHLGDFRDSNNGNNGRLYLGRRIGGAPWDAKPEPGKITPSRKNGSTAESESVTLVTKERAAQLLHRTDDLAQLATVHPIDVGTKTSGNMMEKLVAGIKPAAQAYQKAREAAGQIVGNPQLHAVQDLRGFNDKPKVISKADMDDLVAKGDHIELLRGVKGHGHISGKKLAEDLRTGEHYPGFGVFGSGTYADATKGHSNVAESTYGYGSTAGILRMALPKTARIIEQSVLERKVPNAPGAAIYLTGMGSTEENWRGVQATLAGYDAIHIDGHSRRHLNYGNRNHSKTEGYYVILNRSILTVQKEDAQGHVIR